MGLKNVAHTSVYDRLFSGLEHTLGYFGSTKKNRESLCSVDVSLVYVHASEDIKHEYLSEQHITVST